MLVKEKSIAKLIKELSSEKIETWFDLGLFLDRIREDRLTPPKSFTGTFNEYRDYVTKGGIAFITFQYSIDGVSIEVQKYTKIFEDNFPQSSIHLLSGKFHEEANELFDEKIKKHSLEEIQGFNDWKLYKDFFFTKLERGSDRYNSLIIDFWNETLDIVEKLGDYILENDLKLLYLLNVCSNPGNVSLALAIVLLSEYLKIPVINNNHDFYWEGGNSEINKKIKNIQDGPRDFFFINSHIGEFFTILQMIFPWEGRHWINVNINKQQSEHLILTDGHNPFNVLEIGTAVDTREYRSSNKRKKINTFFQFEKMLSRYSDTLISWSVNDVIDNQLVDPKNPRPILIGSRKTKPLDKFLNENIVFLQPTRIIERKRIEIGFYLIKKLFDKKSFFNRFRDTENLKLTVIITGPIAAGHYDYFLDLINDFKDLLKSLDKKVRDKVYLALLFSEMDKEKFKTKFEKPVGIPELYNIASLVLLPSETEGRGLPIIEATACGTPIFCSRYYPENVYSEVIGEHLPEEKRLKVIEFNGTDIEQHHVDSIVERVLFPHNFIDEITQNKNVIDERYSLPALNMNVQEICHRLYLQMKGNKKAIKLAKLGLLNYSLKLAANPNILKDIVNCENREFLPGFGRMRFMIYLKSLIDPSYFRNEEKEFRGFIFSYARDLLSYARNFSSFPEEKIALFFNTVESLFLYKEGNVEIRHDHSLPYRHRNTNNYPYQDYTVQELTGIVNSVFHEILEPIKERKIETAAHFFTDWDLALSQLTSSEHLAIDDRAILIRKLQANIPIAYFPGKYVKNEMEFFVLQSVRSRLELGIEEELKESMLIGWCQFISPIYVFVNKKSTIDSLSRKVIEKFIDEGQDDELKLLYKHKVIRIIETKQTCLGIHFKQLGDEALKVLKKIKEDKGILISNRPYSSMMTDIVDIERFHIGKVTHPMEANILGIPMESGYIQFVPASVRPTLAYPTPIQTAKDLHDILHSDKFKRICNEFGEEKVYEIIREDAIKRMSPLNKVIEDNFESKNKAGSLVEYNFVSGVYKDKMPWNGAIAKVKSSSDIDYAAITSLKTKRVTDFIKDFEKKENAKVELAWNGGYILNAELVGKLGLAESYIGSPLGLLIQNGKIVSPPLFKKPALIFNKDGSVNIRRVDCSKGLSVSRGTFRVHFPLPQYNTDVENNCSTLYDLMYEKTHFKSYGNVIVRLAGNVIKDIIFTDKDDEIEIIPVGLHLSIPRNQFPDEWNEIGLALDIEMDEFKEVNYAIEAGPMLISEGKVCVDMEAEGWKTKNSIKTQAARLDYTDMRGPKIATGLDKDGNVVVLTINGRIRESVGATHFDMAEILLEQGVVSAMGFDPGGSSTLIVDGKQINISPYNSSYEENIYSLLPESRAVSNAILVYTKNNKM